MRDVAPFLCAYAHGRPIAGFSKSVFDGRSPLRKMFSEAEVTKTFQQRMEADCQVYSFMSIAQAAAELTALYPKDVQLASAAIQVDVVRDERHLRCEA